MDGVNKVNIDWRTRTVKIDFHSTKTSEKAIRAKLKDSGFPAVEAGAALKEGASQDYLTLKDAPPKPEGLAVWGKATIVAICTPGCACKTLKADLDLFAKRVAKVAVRIIVVDSPKHPAAAYLPPQADIPYVFVFDTKTKRQFAGPAEDGKAMYRAVETALGVKKSG